MPIRIRRRRLFWAGIALLVVGAAFLVLPPYAAYCEGNEANDYNCAAYEIVVALVQIAETYNGFITALATIAVAAFTLTLWRSGEKTTRLTKIMAVTARRQMLISGQQTDIQRKQHALERLQFFVTHRPRLHVRHVSIHDPGADVGHPTDLWNDGGEIKGSLVVVNVGGSSATIVHSRYRIYFSQSGLPATAPYDHDSRGAILLFETILEAGVSCGTVISDKIIMEPRLPEGETELRRFSRGQWQLYVMGQIQYRDENKVERFMGFCRQRGDDGIFRPVANDDYEYQD